MVGLFRVGPDHPWPAWHGDTVRAVSDGTAQDERDGIDCDGYLDGWDLKAPPPDFAPCRQHAHHLSVRGPWHGIIPTDGLIPIDDRAREILAALAVSRG